MSLVAGLYGVAQKAQILKGNESLMFPGVDNILALTVSDEMTFVAQLASAPWMEKDRFPDLIRKNTKPLPTNSN